MSKKLLNQLLAETSALASLPAYSFLVLLFLLLGRVQLAVDLFIGLALAYVVTTAIRLAYPRTRPLPEKPTGLLERLDAASFPSLHSYRAGLFILVPLHYMSVELGILFGIAAVMVWYTRYALRRHHITDIAAGAALGIITALAIL